jgi:hypothetical protein
MDSKKRREAFVRILPAALVLFNSRDERSWRGESSSGREIKPLHQLPLTGSFEGLNPAPALAAKIQLAYPISR